MAALRRAVPGLVVLGAVLLQTTVVWQLTIFGIRPDLVLVGVAIYGLGSEGAGVALGLGAGLLEDLLTGRLLGLHALALGAAGLLSGALGRRMVRENLLVVMLAVFLAGALEEGILGLVYEAVFRGRLPVDVLLHTAGLVAVYDMFLAIPVHGVFRCRRRPVRLGMRG